jgi:hypothetical protein
VAFSINLDLKRFIMRCGSLPQVSANLKQCSFDKYLGMLRSVTRMGLLPPTPPEAIGE